MNNENTTLEANEEAQPQILNFDTTAMNSGVLNPYNVPCANEELPVTADNPSLNGIQMDVTELYPNLQPVIGALPSEVTVTDSQHLIHSDVHFSTELLDESAAQIGVTEQVHVNKPKKNTKKKKTVKEEVHKSAPLRSTKAQDYLRKLLANNHGIDGEDHINTTIHARTKLGHHLHINALAPFRHPDLGSFKSLGGLWYFVSGGCQDQAFRNLHGNVCRIRGQEIPFREIEGFKYIIAEATWMKILQNQMLFDAMVENELPYKCYTLVGEMKTHQTSAIAEWYLPILEEISKAAKARAQGQNEAFPNFEFLEEIEQRERHMRSTKPAPRVFGKDRRY